MRVTTDIRDTLRYQGYQGVLSKVKYLPQTVRVVLKYFGLVTRDPDEVILNNLFMKIGRSKIS